MTIYDMLAEYIAEQHPDLDEPDLSAYPFTYWNPSYEELVESEGATIVKEKVLGSYQGDIIALVKHPATNLYQIMVWGYGSCSGCDALEGRQGDLPALESLRLDLVPKDEDWGSAVDIADYIRDHDWKGDYLYYYLKDDNGYKWLAEVEMYLRGEV